jgi:SAM-dependent MidA family methyltransferase
MGIHPAAKSFGKQVSAASYALARPNFSVGPVLGKVGDILMNAKGVDTQKPLRLLELGAGTGKFSRSFLEWQNTLGADTFSLKEASLVATEPSVGFRRLLLEELSEFGLKRCVVAAAEAENIPGDVKDLGAPFDGVLVAQV